VFTPGDVIAGSEVWIQDAQAGIAVWGDDNQTQDVVEGFRADELMTFIVWDPETDFEYESEADVEDGSLNWTPDGFTVLSLASIVSRDLTISFRDGWNYISLNVAPGPDLYVEGQNDGPDNILMLEQFAGETPADHQVILFKNDKGRFYAPRSDFRNFRVWDLNEGYALRMGGAGTGTWSGVPIPPDEPILIQNGWNYIPYYPIYELDARAPNYHVLSPILDCVVIAKNTLGRFMAPRSQFSNMPPWHEGQGYQVKAELQEEVWLVYPEEPNQAAVAAPVSEDFGNIHYPEPLLTGENMSVLISGIVGIEISSDDEIAAYSSNGMLVGSGEFEIDGRCGLAIWGNDPTSEEVTGLAEGEAFELRLWDADQKVEIGLQPIRITEGKGFEYVKDGFMIAELGLKPEIPDHFFMSGAYPNPFNSVTHLSFGLPEESMVSIKVFDLSGRLISTLVEETRTAGTHQITWGGENLTSGVYLIRLETSNFKTSQKVVLMK